MSRMEASRSRFATQPVGLFEQGNVRTGQCQPACGFHPARTAADLGPDFGATLTGAEVNWLIAKEYAHTAQDILWRRTKLGLHMSPEQAAAVDNYVQQARMDAATG